MFVCPWAFEDIIHTSSSFCDAGLAACCGFYRQWQCKLALSLQKDVEDMQAHVRNGLAAARMQQTCTSADGAAGSTLSLSAAALMGASAVNSSFDISSCTCGGLSECPRRKGINTSAAHSGMHPEQHQHC